MIILYKAAELLCKMKRLCNTTNNKNFDIKLWQISSNKTLCTLNFQNVALSIIRCKENWL